MEAETQGLKFKGSLEPLRLDRVKARGGKVSEKINNEKLIGTVS